MNRILFAVTLASSLLMSPATRSLLFDPLSALWSQPLAKEGCGFDPNGRCNPAPQPQPAIDEGCGADPDGCSWGS